MNKVMAAIIVGLLIVASMTWAAGFYGTVYKGEGTSQPAGYAMVRIRGCGEDITVSCNATGAYALGSLDGNCLYYLYAWKPYGLIMWTDDAYEYLRVGQYKQHDFHLNPGYPELQED